MKSAVACFALGLALASSEPAAGAGVTNTTAAAAATVPARSMLGMGGITITPERKASPLFTGSSLPRPPRQESRWTVPETQLPTNYISATRLLFEQGLADPRGCDYRVIEVGTGNVWNGDGGMVETHGWVLPGRSAERFAVCWNGLVYPVVSAGTNADLAADVAGLETNGLATWRSVIPEGMTVSPSSLLGLKGCLLLRLGRGDLAARYWQAEIKRGQDFQNAMWSQVRLANPAATNAAGKLPDTDPYLTWATEWAWGLFDRTLCAHMRGDERLALLTARQLAEAQPKIEATCAGRGFPRPPSWESPQPATPTPKPYLGFLDQLPSLLADLERRAKEGNRQSVMQRGLQSITNQTERITALIRDLDLVAARQWGQPGWVNPADDPIVSALIQEGIRRWTRCWTAWKRTAGSPGRSALAGTFPPAAR